MNNGKDIQERANGKPSFFAGNSMNVEEVSQDYARGVLKVVEGSLNIHGYVHGGALVTLADTVAGVCACSRGGSCVTSSCSFEFLRPATGSEITCEAKPKKMGNTLAVIEAILKNEKDVVVATGTFTYAMIK